MEANEVKQDLVVIYLKNVQPSNSHGTADYDRAIIRQWLNDNSPNDEWQLIISAIMPRTETWREHMDEIYESCMGYKHVAVIIGAGCHSTKYLLDRLRAYVERPSYLTTLAVYDKIKLQTAVMVPLPPVTLNLHAIRSCYTSNQLNDLTSDTATIKRLPNGVIELGYTETLSIEIEHRPESLDEKFNSLMFGGLSGLAAYWDITPIYIDPPERPAPVDRSADSAMETCDSEE